MLKNDLRNAPGPFPEALKTFFKKKQFNFSELLKNDLRNALGPFPGAHLLLLGLRPRHCLSGQNVFSESILFLYSFQSS